ncbi:hypothetical protein ACG98G_10445 [Megasphaera hexanoica]|uniref:Chemotaxis protein n=1 Tax=Megasphaera hexanoica TaxID=1675036 RepID=A0ABW7DRW4_9FIRM|nr:hypothetical protein [Megasphaera hexanoica]
MYLPSKEEAETIVQKNKTILIAGVLCFILAIAGAWLVCRHYDDAASAENNNIIDTVQSAERDNQRARDDIGNAASAIERSQEQLDRATADIDRATESVTRLQKSTANNTAELDQCQKLIETGRGNIAAAKSIFANIDKENKSNGTQTSSH